MKKLLGFLIVLMLLYCDESTRPAFDDPGYIISGANADSLNITFTGYDRITITHISGTAVKSRDFRQVGIGMLDSAGYHELDAATGTYEGSTDAFTFSFIFPVRLDSTKTETKMRIRYYHRNSGSTDIDTTIFQYKYPYPNAEIFVYNSVFPYPDLHFQAFARLENKIYIHPTGPLGFFEYDLTTGAKRECYQYSAGDALAADSGFVFIDLFHNAIGRYNLLTDTKDLDFPGQFGFIRALETYQGLLYVVDSGSDPGRLYRFTYAGSLVDSTDFSWFAYHIAISDGILYTGDADTTIRRIDLATMTELPAVSAPARSMEGIRIYNGHLYYCDWYKNIVGFVPLVDLE